METVFNSVGPYEILTEIGRGGMATVFLASDTRSDRRVALKLVPTGSDREAREILDAERWGAQLQEQFCANSAYVPRVYEHGTSGGYFYIAMEYLEGENLSDVIARGPLAADRSVAMTMQLCEFLEAAHGFETAIDGKPRRSLVHGDLKPRNIRVVDGDRIKVLDFGIAKALSLSRRVTRNDFGTLAYMSPESFDSGGDIDAHADLWAVGVLLYEMVSGVQPFSAPDTRRLEQRIRSRQPPPPLDHGCPAGLEAIVAKLLAGPLAERYADATLIRRDLECLQRGEPTQAERDGWPRRAEEPPTRRTFVDAEATRRTVQPGPASPSAPTDTINRPAEPPRERTDRRFPWSAWRQRRRLRRAAARLPGQPPSIGALRAPRLRSLRTVLLVAALALVFNEYRIGARAARLAATVPGRELDELAEAWSEYDALSGGGFHIGTIRLERVLVRQSLALADRVIGNYRTPAPTVREAQWRMAREGLAHAASVAPDNARVRVALRYCDGHLHRINGEARKARRQTVDAQQEFTEAVTAFREAAELRPNWPDPFLGLMRTFIYGLEDVDRGADALQQAQRLGYTPGERESVQLADGYRARGDTLARTARSLAGLPQEKDYLTRAAEAYREAIDRYSKALTFGDVARALRQAQRGLTHIEDRLSTLERDSPAQPNEPEREIA